MSTLSEAMMRISYNIHEHVCVYLHMDITCMRTSHAWGRHMDVGHHMDVTCMRMSHGYHMDEDVTWISGCQYYIHHGRPRQLELLLPSHLILAVIG